MFRVAHVRRTFSPLSETFIYDYVRTIDTLGPESHVVCLERQQASERPWALTHPCEPLGVVERLRAELADRRASAWHGQRRLDAWAIEAQLRRLRPDVVHGHFGPDGALAADGAARLGCPLVVSHHGYDISILVRQEAWRKRYARLWDQASAITVVSRFQRERVIAMGAEAGKVHVIRVGKDMDSYRYEPRRGPVRRLVSVGRVVEKKGHRDAIMALARVNASRAQRVQLRIIGGGPDLDELRELVRSKKLAEQVSLLGARPHEEVVAELRAADAFVLCSKTAANGDEEGVPTVLMEAQAMGLVCVSTTHTGIPEVIPAQSHDLLAREGDVEGIARAMTLLVESSAEQRGLRAERGRAHVVEHFNLKSECTKLLELYHALVSEI